MKRIVFHLAGEEPANGDIFRNDNGIPSLWLSGFRIGNPNPSRRQSEQIRFFRGCLLLKKLCSLSFRIIISSPGLFYPVPLLGLPIHRFGNPPSTFSNKWYFWDILLFPERKATRVLSSPDQVQSTLDLIWAWSPTGSALLTHITLPFHG